jgi:glycerol dehydrogenase
LLGRKGMISASPSAIDKVLPKTGLDVQEHAILTESFHGECCEDELPPLSGIITEKQMDVIIGMGGER